MNDFVAEVLERLVLFNTCSTANSVPCVVPGRKRNAFGMKYQLIIAIFVC